MTTDGPHRLFGGGRGKKRVGEENTTKKEVGQPKEAGWVAKKGEEAAEYRGGRRGHGEADNNSEDEEESDDNRADEGEAVVRRLCGDGKDKEEAGKALAGAAFGEARVAMPAL